MKKLIIIPLLTSFLTVGVAETHDVLRNFHAVEDGKLYRSALLSNKDLEETVKKYNIKTVINLQGAHPDDDWYIQEKNLLDKLNVKLVDIPERTERIPTRDEVRSLFQAFDTTERPILMHCNSGSDRTGEA